MVVAKQLIFGGVAERVYGTVLRIATPEDKKANNINGEETYLVVDFIHGEVEFRGLWLRDCLIVG